MANLNFVFVIFRFHFEIFGNCGGAVGLGMFFMSNEFRIMAKFGLGSIWGSVWGVRAQFLSITYDFGRTYLISLRWPPIDLRCGVHLKHQNLI